MKAAPGQTHRFNDRATEPLLIDDKVRERIRLDVGGYIFFKGWETTRFI